MTWHEKTGECLDVVALQEVGGVAALPIVHDYGEGLAQVTLHECSEIHDYVVFACTQLSSHLSQMMLVGRDCVDHVVHCWKGDRLLGVEMVCAYSMFCGTVNCI